MSSRRRPFDAYMTPESAVRELLTRIPIRQGHTVLEPCSGDGAIAVPLITHGCDVYTNDIDTDRPADQWCDAAFDEAWDLGHMRPERWVRPDWVISNPPFSAAYHIVCNAYRHAGIGVAMLLRLSYLEPTYQRAAWLAQFPPQGLIVLPRISFTGDGKTDSVTCAWMVWLKQHDPSVFPRPILVAPR